MAEIVENAQKGAPVNFVGSNSIPEVFDHDLGSNGTFSLFIESDGGMFEVSPSQVINEASFLIKVRDPSHLDFERLKVMNFTIVARELVTSNPQESRARVTLHIRDQNDNTPEFTRDRYEVEIPEDIEQGATIAWIRANDADSGLFGTAGIRFTRLNGPLAQYLDLDPQTGIVSLGKSLTRSPFDREIADFHYLTVEARDEVGQGNRNSVELLIQLRDVNDNPPIFKKQSYSAFLPENSAEFPGNGFFVSADDRDENGTENAEVRYRIVGGDAMGNFSVDSVSGQLRPNGLIDYERMNPSPLSIESDEQNEDEETRQFNLVVRAYDLGNPSLHSDVTVYVLVSDVNDHAPVFTRNLYQVSIEEDAVGGTKVLQVSKQAYKFSQALRSISHFNGETFFISLH